MDVWRITSVTMILIILRRYTACRNWKNVDISQNVQNLQKLYVNGKFKL